MDRNGMDLTEAEDIKKNSQRCQIHMILSLHTKRKDTHTHKQVGDYSVKNSILDYREEFLLYSSKKHRPNISYVFRTWAVMRNSFMTAFQGRQVREWQLLTSLSSCHVSKRTRDVHQDSDKLWYKPWPVWHLQKHEKFPGLQCIAIPPQKEHN